MQNSLKLNADANAQAPPSRVPVLRKALEAKAGRRRKPRMVPTSKKSLAAVALHPVFHRAGL